MNKSIDIAYGLASEKEMYKVIKNRFDKSLKRTTDKYALFDYESSTAKVELKSRKNTRDKYPTTMIGMNKIIECTRKPQFKYYFVFRFTDCVCYWKFSVKKYQSYVQSGGGRCDRGYDESSIYLYIPINELKILN